MDKRSQIMYRNESFQHLEDFFKELKEVTFELKEDMSWYNPKLVTAFKTYCSLKMLEIVQENNSMKVHNGFKSYPKFFAEDFRDYIDWQMYHYGIKINEDELVEEFIYTYELVDLQLHGLGMKLSKKNLEETLIKIIESTKVNLTVI